MLAVGRDRWALYTSVLLLLCFAAIWQVHLSTQYVLDYDEGVYLCSARAALSGQPLFASVFSLQPPGCLILLTVAFKLFGAPVLVGREVSVFFALVSLSGVG
jgi:4-amino-4-deoxy-L-arabinose transferase-like glycosyltransferase